MTFQMAGYAETAVVATSVASTASTMTLQAGTMYALTGVTSVVSWAAAGVVAAAKTGVDYRKYKKGELSEDDFKKNAKKYAMAGAGGVVGSMGGMAAGFMAGSLVFPGVGSIIGAISGGIAGGIYGQKIGVKGFEKIEEYD